MILEYRLKGFTGVNEYIPPFGFKKLKIFLLNNYLNS